jgi:hypothetical protein
MQLGARSLVIQDETLRVLIRELGDECGRVLELIHQLQISVLIKNAGTQLSVSIRGHCCQSPDLVGPQL